MRKLFGIFAIIALVAMVGCKQDCEQTGVAQEDFDKVQAELVDAKATIEQLQADLEALNAAWTECDSILAARKITRPKAPVTGGNTGKEKEEVKETDKNPQGNETDRNQTPKTPEDQKQRN